MGILPQIKGNHLIVFGSSLVMEYCEPRLHDDVDLRGACKGLARLIANRQNDDC